MKPYKPRFNTKKLIQITLLAAIGAFLMLWQIPYPGAPWLKIEFSDIAPLVAGFAMGPLYGVVVLILKNLIFMILKFEPGEIVGIPMNIIAGVFFVYTSAIIYHSRKTWQTAAFGLFAGAVVLVFVMIPANYYILPLFLKWFIPSAPIPDGEKLMQITLIYVIPYNAIKASLNSVLTFLIYKRISKFLRQND